MNTRACISDIQPHGVTRKGGMKLTSGSRDHSFNDWSLDHSKRTKFTLSE